MYCNETAELVYAGAVEPNNFKNKEATQSAVTDWFRTGQPALRMNLKPTGPNEIQGIPKQSKWDTSRKIVIGAQTYRC